MIIFSPIALITLVSTNTSTNDYNNNHLHPNLQSLPYPVLPTNPSSNHTTPSILSHLTNSAHATTFDDTTHWGDNIHCSPGDLHRVYFQNLDGLHNDNKEIDLYVESMLNYQVGTYCWTDPSLDFLQPTAKSKLKGRVPTLLL
jgi:hypothetical protein